VLAVVEAHAVALRRSRRRRRGGRADPPRGVTLAPSRCAVERRGDAGQPRRRPTRARAPLGAHAFLPARLRSATRAFSPVDSDARLCSAVAGVGSRSAPGRAVIECRSSRARRLRAAGGRADRPNGSPRSNHCRARRSASKAHERDERTRRRSRSSRRGEQLAGRRRGASGARSRPKAPQIPRPAGRTRPSSASLAARRAGCWSAGSATPRSSGERFGRRARSTPRPPGRFALGEDRPGKDATDRTGDAAAVDDELVDARS